MQVIECKLCENFQLAIFPVQHHCVCQVLSELLQVDHCHTTTILLTFAGYFYVIHPTSVSVIAIQKTKTKRYDCIFAFLICNFVANRIHATVSKRTLLKNELLSPNLTMLVCENDRNKVYKTVLIDTHWQQAGRLKCHLQISATQQRTDNKYLCWNQSVHINHSNPTLVHLNQHWSHSFFRSKNCALMKNFNRFIPGLSKYD